MACVMVIVVQKKRFEFKTSKTPGAFFEKFKNSSKRVQVYRGLWGLESMKSMNSMKSTSSMKTIEINMIFYLNFEINIGKTMVRQ